MSHTSVEEPAIALPLEGWPDVFNVEDPDRRVLAAVALVAVAVDAALRSGFLGVGGALVFVLSAGGLVASSRISNRAALPLVGAACFFGATVAWRASGAVLAFDVAAALTLLVLAASFARRGDPFDLTVPRVLGRGLYAGLHGLLAPAYPFRGLRFSGRAPAGVVRGALLAAPVVLVVGALLASSDAVFASFFRLPDDFGDPALHGVLLILGGWWAGALFRLASAEPFTVPTTTSTVTLGRAEVSTVSGALAAVLAVFAASQVVAVVRGAEYVERTTGLTYAEYARTGFFQLLAASFVALATLWLLRPSVTTRSHASLVLAVAAGNLVIVASALRRLFLYEDAYGLTLLRLGAVIASIWVGVVIVLTAVAVLEGRLLRPDAGPRRHWLLPASAATALALVAGASIVNVQAYIVERNVGAFARTGRLDVAYLVSLSDDAVPALVRSLDRMGAADRGWVVQVLCARHSDSSGRGSWLETNLAERRASAALDRTCGRAAGVPVSPHS